DVANFLNTSLRGLAATSYREGIESIDVVLRADAVERDKLSLISELSIPTRAGKSVPLGQVATVSHAYEHGLVWRRNREPSISVRGQIYDGRIQAPTVTAQVLPLLEPIRARLPAGYRIETGGAVEESAKGQSSVNAGFPLFLAVVLTVLMVQLGSFSRTTMVVLTAPLGLIGVVLFLLLFNKPFGFVAMLGTIALFGMIMRNSVILVDQIEQDVEKGLSLWEAIVESAVRRLRPIALTAAAAVLAMIPLTRSAFFGPMAVAIMGGLIVATLLTLLFVPALYAAWYRVKREPGKMAT
ncbi:MAG TPA: efflux RND transporter permease subunit, partial [Zoogloea sp.]|nr:efflux RND transporter permease subunit [Zoogloea sp.]